MGRFDDDEKRLEKENAVDTTDETFYDDLEERGELVGVSVISYTSDKLGKCYSIQIPNCNIWMTEEMFKRVAVGVSKAMKSIEDSPKSC